MDLRNVPIIRLEIEELKSTIQSQLGVRGSELGTIISEQIDKAFADYPFERKVKEIVYEQMTKAIESYFKYGKGSDAINAAVSTLFEEKQ